MQPFDFFTNYCVAIIFLTLYILMGAALTAGSAMWGATFGFSAVLPSVRDDIIRDAMTRRLNVEN